MFRKIASSVVVAGAIAASTAMGASAQAIPAVGIITGGAQAAAATCEQIGKEPKAVAAAQANRLWLPIVVSASEAPNCPAVAVGASVLLDAETSAARELAMGPGDPSVWYLQDVASTLQTGSVISPTIEFGPVEKGAKPHGDMKLVGIWPGPIDDYAETPVNWKEYKVGEREARLNERPGELFMLVDEHALFNNKPRLRGSQPLALLCPQAVGRKWLVERLTFVPVPIDDGYATLVAHPLEQLPSVCPQMMAYTYMPSGPSHKYIPANVLQEIDKRIEEESYEYKRKLWVFPSPENLVPQPATVVWTATAIGSGVMIYAQVQRGGGFVGGGGGLLYFSSMTKPKAAE